MMTGQALVSLAAPHYRLLRGQRAKNPARIRARGERAVTTLNA